MTDQYPVGPHGYVLADGYVKARFPDARLEERKKRPNYGLGSSLIVVATFEGKTICLGPACAKWATAWRKAAEKLGWHELMTPPTSDPRPGLYCKAHEFRGQTYQECRHLQRVAVFRGEKVVEYTTGTDHRYTCTPEEWQEWAKEAEYQC